MQKLTGIQAPTLNGALADLESFRAWAEDIKTSISQADPSLYEVLGEISFSKQPIEEGDIIQASQRIKKERQKALRVLRAKKQRASFEEEETHQSTDEHTSTEAYKLQRRSEGRQLGCVLVQKTKGETQLQATRWLSATSGWEAWRQLNLSFHFKLLTSLIKPDFDDQPASCLQQFNAWKERLVIYQQLSGEQLRDIIKLSVVVNGLKGSAKDFVLLNLDGDSSFRDLDTLLAIYVSMHVPHESSLDSLSDRACRDEPEETCFTQEGEYKSKPTKGKGEACPPQPSANKGRGKQHSFRQTSTGAIYAGRKGTEPKLAGGTATSSINSGTYSTKLGTEQTNSSVRLQKLHRRDLTIQSTRQTNWQLTA